MPPKGEPATASAEAAEGETPAEDEALEAAPAASAEEDKADADAAPAGSAEASEAEETEEVEEEEESLSEEEKPPVFKPNALINRKVTTWRGNSTPPHPPVLFE